MTDPGQPQARCSGCGQHADGPAPLTWSTTHDRRGTTVLCEACTRRHLRAMEAKLDEGHW